MREWLVNLRNQAGLTQEEVAISAGIARTTYAMIEQQKRSPSVSVAMKIANVLKFEWTLFFQDQCHDSRKSGVAEAI